MTNNKCNKSTVSTDLPQVSVVMPAYNEAAYIATCLESVYSQDYPKEKTEVIVVDGASTDDTVKIIQAQFPDVILLHNPRKIVPISMNMGIAISKGDYIIRLDAHSSYPSNYFSALIDAAIKLKADNVGSVCFTDVKEKTKAGLAIKEVLSNRFGVGNSLFRTGISHVCEADTVPFGCFKRDVFERFGYYDERLVRNQDIELNKRIKRSNGKIYLIPDTHCIYYARSSYRSFAKSNYGNGLWNMLTVHYTKSWKSLSIRHFIPLIFVLSLILPLLASLFYLPIAILSTISTLFYLIVILMISIQLNRKDKNLSIFHLVWAFICLHVLYGWGSVVGLYKVLILKLRN